MESEIIFEFLFNLYLERNFLIESVGIAINTYALSLIISRLEVKFKFLFICVPGRCGCDNFSEISFRNEGL